VTELNFKGKEFVYNHHLAVPFRPLVPDESKGIGPVALDGNLIVHGDNLHALKALLPLYAGKVDCIFIDPPYNTGNEGWAYNDNVNAPMIREWLESNPIGIEDGLRHDKWCAMMWPRLRLLHELLSESGSIWITLDDHEIHRARQIMDEIFGVENFIGLLIRRTKAGGGSAADYFAIEHDYILAYCKRGDDFPKLFIEHDEEYLTRYAHEDDDGRYFWDTFVRNGTKTTPYTIHAPDGTPLNRSWFKSEDVFKEDLKKGDIKIFMKQDGEWSVQFKQRLSKGRKMRSVLYGTQYISDKDEIERMGLAFDHPPKPVELITTILEAIQNKSALVLDSFSGTATTAHSVLESNKRDGGNRRFILVEMEDYADKLTAERVRRVINGYAFKGTQRTELLRDKITWTKLKNADKLTEAVVAIENLHGHEYDAIKKTVKNGELIVTGEKNVEDKTEGLGGSFTYCTLGDPVELDKILSGETLPSFDGLGSVLFHMATAHAFDPATMREDDFYLGTVEGQHLWLIYKPDLDWLKSPEAALTLKRAKDFAATDKDARHLVFAPARYVSQKMLAEQNIPVEFVPLPFALYRIDRS